MLATRQILHKSGLVAAPFNVKVLDGLNFGHSSHIQQPHSYQTAFNVPHSQMGRANGQQKVELVLVNCHVLEHGSCNDSSERKPYNIDVSDVLVLL